MNAPLRPVAMGDGHAERIERPDGVAIVRSTEPLQPYPRVLTDRLRHWAETTPERLFLAQRTSEGPWRSLTYADAWEQVQRLAQALLDRGLSPERPVAILSENDIEQALLTLAGQHVGAPCAIVSPAYSLISSDYERLRYVLGLAQPGLIFASDAGRFARAIASAAPAGVEVVAVEPGGTGATPFADLAAASPTPSVDAAHAALDPDSLAKLLFTSGSTGMPKGVVNTHRMLCSNLQMGRQAYRFVQDEPPVIVDWLPWSHTFGGNHTFGVALYNGGAFYIDDGRPTPAGLAKTLRNLREIAPTLYFNVPRGYEELLPHLREDEALAARFFSRLKLMKYAGAGMSRTVWDGLQDAAAKACGKRVQMITTLGSTETGPTSLLNMREASGPGEVGTPVPGVELKLVPNEGKLELRVRGPNVTPGYWRQPELTAKAFDDEGFYKIGDAVKYLDPSDLDRGFLFDGRISEDFKLATGTWVSVGVLRGRILEHFGPLVREAIVTGHDRDFVGALLAPDLEALRRLAAGLDAAAAPRDVIAHPAVRARLQSLLDELADRAAGSSERLVRIAVLEEPLSLDAGELTDKGSCNQRKVLERRAALVETLYASRPAPEIIAWRGL